MLSTKAFTNFNPRSREGSDAPNFTYDKYQVKISIHAPVKGATVRFGHRREAGRNFNPRSREGSDLFNRQEASRQKISIHAPVKGATREYRAGTNAILISIHAPVKGATQAK